LRSLAQLLLPRTRWSASRLDVKAPLPDSRSASRAGPWASRRSRTGAGDDDAPEKKPSSGPATCIPRPGDDSATAVTGLPLSHASSLSLMPPLRVRFLSLYERPPPARRLA